MSDKERPSGAARRSKSAPGQGLRWRFATRLLPCLLVMPALMGVPHAVHAHHSFGMFDSEKTIVVSGQVREFQWVNPHTWIQLVATSAGKSVEWSIEGRSPNVLSRRGWTRSTLRPGDRISVTMHPLKSGKPGGAIVSIRFPDGRVLNADTPKAVDTNEEAGR